MDKTVAPRPRSDFNRASASEAACPHSELMIEAREAAQSVARGEYARALMQFRSLANAYPQTRAYAAMVRVLASRMPDQ